MVQALAASDDKRVGVLLRTTVMVSLVSGGDVSMTWVSLHRRYDGRGSGIGDDLKCPEGVRSAAGASCLIPMMD